MNEQTDDWVIQRLKNRLGQLQLRQTLALRERFELRRLLDELNGSGSSAVEPVPAPEPPHRTAQDRYLPSWLRSLPERPDHDKPPEDPGEALVRLSALEREISEFQKHICDVRRDLNKRVREERARRLARIKSRLERQIPVSKMELQYFDVMTFLRKNRAVLHTAATLAAACHEPFPNWNTDFKELPGRLRHDLFLKLSSL